MTPTQLHGFLKAQGRGTILCSSPHPLLGRWGLGTAVRVGSWGIEVSSSQNASLEVEPMGIKKWGQVMESTKALGMERRWMGEEEVRGCGVWERKAGGKRQTTVDEGMSEPIQGQGE